MTVRRSLTFRFSSPPEVVDRAIVDVLATVPEYRRVVKTDGGWLGRHRPASWPLTLSTELQIDAPVAEHEATTVTASTKSQWIILGDIVGSYKALLRLLGERIQAELDRG